MRARISHIYHPTQTVLPSFALVVVPPPIFFAYLCRSRPFFHIGQTTSSEFCSNNNINTDEDEDVASRTNRTSVMCENYFITTVFVVTPAISLFLLCDILGSVCCVVELMAIAVVCMRVLLFYFCLFICFNRIQFGQQFHLARCCSSIIFARLRCNCCGWPSRLPPLNSLLNFGSVAIS